MLPLHSSAQLMFSLLCLLCTAALLLLLCKVHICRQKYIHPSVCTLARYMFSERVYMYVMYVVHFLSSSIYAGGGAAAGWWHEIYIYNVGADVVHKPLVLPEEIFLAPARRWKGEFSTLRGLLKTFCQRIGSGPKLSSTKMAARLVFQNLNSCPMTK